MPDDPRIIFHIGASKCGSTSLQAALCQRPEFTGGDGRRFEYVAIDRSGGLLRGNSLARRNKVSLVGSAASPNATSVHEVETLLAPSLPALRAMIEQGTTPILSCEGWARGAEAFAEAGFIERIGGGAHVILFVRPPVDWMNSAWWQWGVWTPLTLDTYVKRNVHRLRWPVLAREWRDVPGVAKIDVGLATSDVTARFFPMIDAETPPMVESNTGLPPAFLRFLLRNRKYRPSAHSPKTEFVVARHLPPGRFPTPWVMTEAHVERVVGVSAKMQPVLRKLLSPEDRAELDADPRWTRADAYADRQVDDLARHDTPEALADLIGLLRAGLAEDGPAARADAARCLSGQSDPVGIADAMIARAVDEMYGRLGGKSLLMRHLSASLSG